LTPIVEILRGDLKSVRSDTEDELKTFVARIDAAVDALAAKGLIDRERVGLIGFSRAGFSTLYTITHPGKTRIKASIILDSMTGSWTEYTSSPENPGYDGSRNQYESFWGKGLSFWQNKEGFLRAAPIFNVDKVQGPTLFQYVNDGSITGAPEILGAYQLNGRPAEWMNFGPLGFHWLQTPHQRAESMTASVEWMDFWLNGVAPADEARSLRWSTLKRDWLRQQAWEAAGNPAGSPPNADFQPAATGPTKGATP
jgi:predicted transcriptional regulator